MFVLNLKNMIAGIITQSCKQEGEQTKSCPAVCLGKEEPRAAAAFALGIS